ncbi:unnamed protein product, partial [Effrenium voratum]
SYSSSEPGDAPMGAGPVAPAVLGEDTAGEEADAAGLAAVPEAGVTAPANSEKREDLLAPGAPATPEERERKARELRQKLDSQRRRSTPSIEPEESKAGLLSVGAATARSSLRRTAIGITAEGPTAWHGLSGSAGCDLEEMPGGLRTRASVGSRAIWRTCRSRRKKEKKQELTPRVKEELPESRPFPREKKHKRKQRRESSSPPPDSPRDKPRKGPPPPPPPSGGLASEGAAAARSKLVAEMWEATLRQLLR